MPTSNFIQSDYLIQIVDINSYLMANSADSDMLASKLIWIYTVCKSRAYQGSAEPGFTLVKTAADGIVIIMRIGTDRPLQMV